MDKNEMLGEMRHEFEMKLRDANSALQQYVGMTHLFEADGLEGYQQRILDITDRVREVSISHMTDHNLETSDEDNYGHAVGGALQTCLMMAVMLQTDILDEPDGPHIGDKSKKKDKDPLSEAITQREAIAPRRNISKHITQAFEDVPLGEFRTTVQIRDTITTEYHNPDDRPSSGAISASLTSYASKGKVFYAEDGSYIVTPVREDPSDNNSRQGAVKRTIASLS